MDDNDWCIEPATVNHYQTTELLKDNPNEINGDLIQLSLQINDLRKDLDNTADIINTLSNRAIDMEKRIDKLETENRRINNELTELNIIVKMLVTSTI